MLLLYRFTVGQDLSIVPWTNGNWGNSVDEFIQIFKVTSFVLRKWKKLNYQWAKMAFSSLLNYSHSQLLSHIIVTQQIISQILYLSVSQRHWWWICTNIGGSLIHYKQGPLRLPRGAVWLKYVIPHLYRCCCAKFTVGDWFLNLWEKMVSITQRTMLIL